MPFRSFIATALSGGVSTIPVSPNSNLCTRLLALADNYAQYRFLDLKYRMFRVSGATSVQAAAFISGVTDTGPSSILTGVETGNATILGAIQTVPSDWVNVPRSILAGQLPYYKTVVGSPDAIDEIQGNLYLLGTGTENVHVEVRGTIEFKQPVDAANTPSLEVRARRILEKEKARLQRLAELSVEPVSATQLYSNMVATKGPNQKN